MTNLLVSALAGAVFGLALAAPPGPMNALIAEESAVRGWGAGFTAGLGAMSADGVFFVLTILGVVQVVERAPTLRGVMVGIGGVLMLYFAYDAASEVTESSGVGNSITVDSSQGEDCSQSPTPQGKSSHDVSPERHPLGLDARAFVGFRRAFLLAITNPYQILFWLTAGVGMLRPGTLAVLSYLPYLGESLAGNLVVATGSPALIVGFFCGIGTWIVAFPGTLVTIGRRVDAFSTVVSGGSAVVLALFGIVFLRDAVITLA